MIKIVKAKTNHIPSLSRLFKKLDREKWNTSDKKKVLADLPNAYVALNKNKVVGALVLRFNKHNSEIVKIVSTQSGVGRKLIGFAIKKAKQKKVSKIWCWSMARFNAHGFYQKMGFEEQFLHKKHFYNEDCWFFGKVLSKI